MSDHRLDYSRLNLEGECLIIVWNGDYAPRKKMEIAGEDFGTFLLAELLGKYQIS